MWGNDRPSRRRCILIAAVFAALIAVNGAAQDNTDLPEAPHTVPLLTGTVAFVPIIDGGNTTLQPIAAPVVLVPLGQQWLIESRATFEGYCARPADAAPYTCPVSKQVDYLQLDYIANRYVTFTAGRFLTPFGIYNERLYPRWIRNLQTEPLIFGLEESSSDGLMARGGFELNRKADLNFAAYFSTLSTLNKFESDRKVGGRIGFFFPGKRIEVGASVLHLLQVERNNTYGLHAAWQPLLVPFDLRSEYVRSTYGQGYWLEGAYKLSQASYWQRVLRRAQVVGRLQQFLSSNNPDFAAAVDEYSLPAANTRQLDFGVNYYPVDGLKFIGSYGRAFSSDGDKNVWTFGVTYRFIIPLGRTK
jgi:hypothetical protein